MITEGISKAVADLRDAGCDADADRIESAITKAEAAEPVASVPDGFALVPSKMYVSPEQWDAAQFAFGGPGTDEEEGFYDCTLWVGEIENDDGSKTYGLHVSCDECPEEGSITLSEFAAPPTNQEGAAP